MFMQFKTRLCHILSIFHFTQFHCNHHLGRLFYALFLRRLCYSSHFTAFAHDSDMQSSCNLIRCGPGIRGGSSCSSLGKAMAELGLTGLGAAAVMSSDPYLLDRLLQTGCRSARSNPHAKPSYPAGSEASVQILILPFFLSPLVITLCA